MMHCLLDQISYIEDLSDFSDSAQNLHWKICNYGYDLYLKTGKLVWAFDPAVGTPSDWKRKMMKDGCWGEEVFLHQLSSSDLTFSSGCQRQFDTGI